MLLHVRLLRGVPTCLYVHGSCGNFLSGIMESQPLAISFDRSLSDILLNLSKCLTHTYMLYTHTHMHTHHPAATTVHVLGMDRLPWGHRCSSTVEPVSETTWQPTHVNEIPNLKLFTHCWALLLSVSNAPEYKLSDICE